MRNVFHGAQAHVGFGAEPILPVLAGEEHDASAALLVMLEELTRRAFGGLSRSASPTRTRRC